MRTRPILTSVVAASLGLAALGSTAAAQETAEKPAASPAVEKATSEAAEQPPAFDEAAAVRAAEKWLGHIDQGEYGQAWDDAAAILRDLTEREDWTKLVTRVRKPLGKMESRKVLSKESRTSLPGVADGKYVAIQFETSFEHKARGIETVIPMYEDGEWKVATYLLR